MGGAKQLLYFLFRTTRDECNEKLSRLDGDIVAARGKVGGVVWGHPYSPSSRSIGMRGFLSIAAVVGYFKWLYIQFRHELDNVEVAEEKFDKKTKAMVLKEELIEQQRKAIEQR